MPYCQIYANIYLYTSATVAAGSRLRILNEVDKNVRQAPLRRNLPLPRPGVDRPLRGNCHPLSSTPDNQVRCVFGSAPYQNPPSTVRNMRAVLKKASWGTRRIFRGVPCQKQLLPHRTHLQCAKRPPLSLFAPAAPSLAPSTALGTRNDPRSDVSRRKKTSKSIKTF